MHEMWRAGRLTEREPGGRCPGPGAMGVSLSSVSVEVMNTESGADGTTSSRELMPLIRASKRGVLWYANYNSIKLFSLKNKNRHIPPSALRTHPVCAPSGRKLTSQHRGQAVSRSHHFIVGVIAGLAALESGKGRGQGQGGASLHLAVPCPLTSA